MDSPKHSPGPWTEECNLIKGPTGHNIIALIQYTESGYVRANARLIAAAPELLSALKSILPLAIHTSPQDVTVGAAIAAIDKAEEGESKC